MISTNELTKMKNVYYVESDTIGVTDVQNKRSLIKNERSKEYAWIEKALSNRKILCTDCGGD